MPLGLIISKWVSKSNKPLLQKTLFPLNL
jgi:hypothetical protein